MKKIYEAPVLKEEVIEIDDIIAVSSADFGSLPGDTNQSYPWGR